MIQRRSVAVSIICSIVTCGLYELYWMACINNDVDIINNDESSLSGLQVAVLTLITCGIYGIFWCYITSRKINEIKQKRQEYVSGSEHIWYTILWFFKLSIVALALMQNDINKLGESSDF